MQETALARVVVEIQEDRYGQYVRVLVHETSIIEGPRITPTDLKEFLSELGFTVKMSIGVFGGENDDQYDENNDPIFVKTGSTVAAVDVPEPMRMMVVRE